MLLTIRSTSPQATNLSFLLRKHPSKCQSFNLKFGTAQVFYPEVSEQACTAALLLQIDPVGLVRRGGPNSLDQYVNDRPYTASSFFSVAMNDVFRDTLMRKCKEKPELVDMPLELEANVTTVRCQGGEQFLRGVFEPLGYVVECTGYPLDPELGWTDTPYFGLKLKGCCPLHQLLNHLYILLPVLDTKKHYFVDSDELEKLLRKGEGWLSQHPLRESIVHRYLRKQGSLTREALARLQEETPGDIEEVRIQSDEAEEALEKPARLHELRLDRVCQLLKESGARKVLDMGCGSGKLLSKLLKVRQFEQIWGVDVSYAAVVHAKDRLRYQEGDNPRLTLLHGSLLYCDSRLKNCDAAALVEVIEHLDPPRLRSCQQNLFGFLRPKTVLISTPNREYNQLYPSLSAGRFRHRDHRFEWTRLEFQAWGDSVAQNYGYSVRYEGLGPEDVAHGSPSQIGVFTR